MRGSSRSPQQRHTVPNVHSQSVPWFGVSGFEAAAYAATSRWGRHGRGWGGGWECGVRGPCRGLCPRQEWGIVCLLCRLLFSAMPRLLSLSVSPFSTHSPTSPLPQFPPALVTVWILHHLPLVNSWNPQGPIRLRFPVGIHANINTLQSMCFECPSMAQTWRVFRVWNLFLSHTQSRRCPNVPASQNPVVWPGVLGTVYWSQTFPFLSFTLPPGWVFDYWVSVTAGSFHAACAWLFAYATLACALNLMRPGPRRVLQTQTTYRRDLKLLCCHQQ